MEQKTINLYEFSEFSQASKERAMAENPFCSDYIFEEARSTIDAFCQAFNIKDYIIDIYHNFTDVNFKNFDEDILYLSGARLQKYIWNNYKNDIYKGKYYSVKNNSKAIKHKRVKYTIYQNGVFNAYYSAFFFEDDCPLTGMCYDYDILQPIYNFLNSRPKNINFKELLNDCFYSLLKTLREEIEFRESEEGFAEDHEGALFFEDGTIYEY